MLRIATAFAVSFAISVVVGCSTRPTGIIGCACSVDADCEADDALCDGCNCRAPCTEHTDCEDRDPNCEPSTGRCLPACADNSDCGTSWPVCDPATGLCQALCTETACPPGVPNCDPSSGFCVGECPAEDCPDPASPNCGPDGVCFELCDDHGDCVNSGFPNCSLDSAASDAGLCRVACTSNPDCDSAAFPNCEPLGGVCVAPCASNTDCPTSAPNCDDTTGLCFGACTDNTGCPLAASPVCDPDSGLCQGPCPATACPGGAPNCNDATGLCYGACTTASDCPEASEPNCDPGNGVCFAPCTSDGECIAALPNCDEANGLCYGACASHTDCPEAGQPNCDSVSGSCLPPCTTSSDCPSSSPNCVPATGLCGAACSGHADCLDPANPNCDDSTGLCGPACVGDGDCPGEICESGLCEPGECVVDTDCSPPATVCESERCVLGCQSNADCLPDRCRLTGASPNHCESRDCTSDAECSVPVTVCDTAGGADPTGGGYCVGGCLTYDDCPMGYDCTAAVGACVARDYGDVGSTPCNSPADCSNCPSGLGVLDANGVMMCTGFCCSQHDCPSGWGCRPSPDGVTGDQHCSGSCTHDVCVPLEVSNGAARRDAPCVDDGDCRSNECRGQRCRDSCCSDADCALVGQACTHSGGGPTHCVDQPAGSPFGTAGCATPAGTIANPVVPDTSCDSLLCFSLSLNDQGCTDASQCPATRNNYCGDFTCSTCSPPDERGDPADDSDNDCVYDFCVEHCCTSADCGSPADGRDYFCGKWRYNVGDMNVCLLVDNAGSGAEGSVCTLASQCASNFCSPADGVCRERCCRDSDCSDPAFPRCAVEDHSVLGVTRALTVCLP